MPSIDTNVLVRWLVDDDERQSVRAQRLFESARTNRTPLFIPATVALELEWVLRSRYEFDKATVLGTFNTLLETQEVQFQEEAALEHALHLYRQGAAEFADCLHVGLSVAAVQAPLLTFDQKAARLAGVELLDG
jgi:predicted nucleic-acid-binding protein